MAPDDARGVSIVPLPNVEPRTSNVGVLAVVWVLAVVGLTILAYWLWETKGLVSTELLFWEGRARLAAQAPPPTGVMLTSPPLLLYLTLVSGSAGRAALACGAIGIAAMLLFGRVGRAWIWMLPLLVHPAVILGAVAYPGSLVVALLIAGALCGFIDYLRYGGMAALTCGGLTLGLLTLAHWYVWPLWLVLFSALLLGTRKSWPERWTLCLVALFPPLFLSGAWLYVNWTETGTPFYFLQIPSLSLSRLEGWADGLHDPLVGWRDSVNQAIVLALPVLIAPVLLRVAYSRHRFPELTAFANATASLAEVRRVSCGERRRKLWATGNTQSPILLRARRREDVGALGPRESLAVCGLLAAPLVLLYVDGASGRLLSPCAAVAFSLAVLIPLARLTGQVSAYGPLVASLLTASVVGSWFLVRSGDTEPAHILAAVEHGGRLERIQPFVELTSVIEARRGPTDRVLFDDRRLFPLAALLDEDIWIPSSRFDYALAFQQPSRWARFIVRTRDDSEYGADALEGVDSRRLADYELVANVGPLSLFERRAAPVAP